MKITMNTNDFISAIKVLDKISVNNVLPILNSVLITVQNGKVKLTRTNVENTINVYFPADFDSYGTILLPKKMVEMLKNLREDKVTITESSIITNRKVMDYNRMNSEEYPDVNRKFNKVFFELPEKELNRMLEVKYCISTDAARPILCGVCFDGNRTVGIDGYRMSVREGNYNSDIHNVVVNSNTINLLDKVINKNSNEKVKVSGETFDGKIRQFVKFEIGNIEVIGLTIHGEYFNYKNFVPQDFETEITVDVSEMLPEVEFMFKASNKEKPDLIKLVTENGKLLLRGTLTEMEFDKEASFKATQKEQNKADDEYDCLMDKFKMGILKKEPERKNVKEVKIYTPKEISHVKSEVEANVQGQDILMGFNVRYIYEALKQTATDRVKLKALAKTSPMIITADGNNFEMVLPVRL